MHILHRADGAFDERDVYPIGELLCIDQRSVHDIHFAASEMTPASMSSSDMWQPEQPSSQTVASLTFFMPALLCGAPTR